MKVVWVLLLCTVTGPFFVYETLRFYSAHKNCSRVYAENHLLLSNALCSDALQRHLHGAKQDAACNKAQEENLVSPVSCAWKSMWIEGEVYRVWTMMTDSRLMIAVITVPCLLLATWLVFWSCVENARTSKQLAMQERMYEKTLEQIGRIQVGGGGGGAIGYDGYVPIRHEPDHRRIKHHQEEEEEDEGDYVKLVRREHR